MIVSGLKERRGVRGEGSGGGFVKYSLDLSCDRSPAVPESTGSKIFSSFAT
jgi:hypothetical protein